MTIKSAEEYFPNDTPTQETQLWTPEQCEQILPYADERVHMTRKEVVNFFVERA